MEYPAPSASEGRPVVEYGMRRLLIVVAVMLASLLETLDSTIVNVSLPTIEGNIGASIDEGIWIVTGYIISNVVAIPLNPFLTRMFGRRAYFAGCIVGFTIASFLCSTATALGPLVAFRVLQGAFGGGLIATSQVVMRETFPPKAIGISSALFAMALILGPAFGPLAGGYITDNFSWKWIFDVNIVPGTLAALVIFALLRNPIPPQRQKIDWTGVGLLALGLGSMQVLLDNGERNDWFADPHMRLAGGLALVALATFAWWQWSGTKSPAVDLHVLRFRSVWTGSLLALAFGALIFAPAIVTPLYSSLVLGYPAFDSGMLLMTRAIPVVILTPVFATMAERGAPVRYMLGTGFVLSAISLYWLATSMTSETPFGTLGVALFVSGIGQSLVLVPLIVGILSTTPAQLNGKISPIITLCVQLGGSVASAVSIAVFDRRTSFHSDAIAGALNLQHLTQSGWAPTPQALSRLSDIVVQQASTLGFADTIFLVAVLAALVVPLALAFPRRKATT
ncbi:MAG TPA: DHA2 family efflux MFS transporter permease subunit [Candidatus Baltobacteraceae bacterium]|nr:DHA2 family efflux MFS transporter permease subunit [Candidatus Baltobacteraceae bacterium]